MVAFRYEFQKLHPEEFGLCQKYGHSIKFWVNGELLACDTHTNFAECGNITLSLTEETARKLMDGSGYFSVSKILHNVHHPAPGLAGESILVPFLEVTGHYHERSNI